MSFSKIIKKPEVLSIASLACFAHCLLLPIITASLPALGHALDNHLFELIFAGFSLLSGGLVIGLGFKQHNNKRVVQLFIIGAIFWIVHIIAEMNHFHIASILLGFALIFILMATFLNHKAIKKCQCCR